MSRAKAVLSLLLCAFAAQAFASGPRFVTGPPFFTGPQGVAIGWKQPHLLYYTDSGDLSSSVSHQSADALVAAAAGVWNVPVASITVAQGGTLAEHVSGRDIYLDSTGMVFPADVMSSNAAAIPLAILYDTDGSVTDTLLGAGASDPAGCNRNAVTETVDGFDPAGFITHAIIVLNGRCTGSAPEMQLQMRYQLMRIFGRVLGVGWSQTNDNVFTGVPTPTNAQALNWPIMHPIDILCGPYTYQCLPNPFQLRTDDIAGLVSVYSIESGATVETGKQVSLSHAQGLEGWVTFPDGQGMSGVNVLVRRQPSNTTVSDEWYEGSSVSGAYFRQAAVAPFVSADPGVHGSLGATDPGLQGRYEIAYFPLIADASTDNLIPSTEPVNPLYTGEYALGPYAAGAVLPAGSPPHVPTRFVTTAGGRPQVNITIIDAPPSCGAGGDGTFADPMQAHATGWWYGLLCGYGHASYVSAAVKPGHTFTLEVTALDALGQPTQAKAMPLIGLFGSGDSATSVPSLGLTPSAFQSKAMGTTTLSASTAQASSIEFGIADARGEGRPDFNYQARFFYADSVSPSRISPAGGTITILGSGFRPGNTVTLNGLPAVALRWTANQIVLSAPRMAAVNATDKIAIDVSVSDTFTGASSTIPGGLTYDSAPALPNTMRTLSAPSGILLVNDVGPVPFAMQVLGSDGVTPVAGEQVVFSATAGTVSWSTCPQAVCSVATNSQGIASITLTPGAAGAVTVQAIDGSLLQSASFTASPQAASMVVLSAPESTVPVGRMSNYWFNVQLVGANGRGLAGRLVTFTVPVGSAQFDGCFTSVCSLVTDQYGTVGGSVMPLAAGTVTVMAASGDLSQTASFSALSSTDRLQAVSLPNPTFFEGEDSGTFSIKLLQNNWAPDPLRPVVFSAAPGVLFGQCGSNTCTMTTNYSGEASTYVIPPSTGTFTVMASYGDLQQTATFTVLPRTQHLNILNRPEDNVPVMTQAAQPFSVQFVENDGITPVTNQTVTLAGVPGSIRQSACPYNSCEVELDSRGIATTYITPPVPGNISLSASYEPFEASTSFVAVGGVQTMHVSQQPGAGGAPVGILETVAVQVLAPDGVTRVPWDPVTFTVVSGPFALVGAATASIQVYTDNSGSSACTGVALGYGPVVMEASDGTLSVTIRFMAGSPPDVLKLVSLPANDSPVGKQVTTAFAVKAYASDGVTTAPNKTVVFSTTAGNVRLGCGAVVCSVVTDNSGAASMGVTPLAAGAIGLLAVEGAATQSISFTSITPTDTMRLVSVPTSGGFAGLPAAGTFTVQVITSDGITPAAGRNVSVAVTNANATLVACAGAASCTLQTDSQGMISTQVTPLAPGLVTLLAAEGNVTQTASFSVASRPDVLRIVSAPASSQIAGIAAQPLFAISLNSGDTGAPLPGRSVVFSASAGVQFAGCSGSPCTALTAADGTAAVQFTPLTAGAYVLTATSGSQSVTISFTAVSKPDLLLLASGPAGNLPVGLPSPSSFAVKLLQGDGVTPHAGQAVAFSVTQGSVAFSGCGGSVCTVNTAADGSASVTITPLAAGTISLTATSGTLTVAVSFTGVLQPDVLRIVSVPADGSYTGQTASVAFSVNALLANGSTPAAGAHIILAVASGSATLGACGGQICTLIADVNGVVSTAVAPVAAGAIQLSATDDSTVSSASFIAVDAPDVMSVITSPASPTRVGSATPFAVRILAADGKTPRAGRVVVFSASDSATTWLACTTASCQVVTGLDGVASVQVVPGTPASITLLATSGTISITTTLQAIANSFSLIANTAAVYLAQDAVTTLTLQAFAQENGAPPVPQLVTWTGSASFAPGQLQSTTAADGLAVMSATLGPLAVNATARVKACAWTNVCTHFDAIGVSASQVQVALASGATQDISGPASFMPVVVRASDGSGHAVTGVSVSVYQTVTALDAPCPDRGRCPSAPVLATQVTVVTTGADGAASIVPLDMPGGGSQTQIAVSAGTQGYTTAVLFHQP